MTDDDNTNTDSETLTENIVTPNDYQATLLHLLGFDHTRLIYHHNGREQRLTDGRPARVVQEILT